MSLGCNILDLTGFLIVFKQFLVSVLNESTDVLVSEHFVHFREVERAHHILPVFLNHLLHCKLLLRVLLFFAFLFFFFSSLSHALC